MNMHWAQVESDQSQRKTFPTKRVGRFFAFVIVWILTMTVLIPHVVIGGVSIGVDDACAAFLLMAYTIYAGYLLLKTNNLSLHKDWLFVAGLWVSLIVTGIVFSIIGGLVYVNQFRLPTEMWQYVKRLLFFYTTCHVSYRGLVSSGNFCRCMLYVLLIAFFIGLIQIMPGSIGDQLAGLYARTESKLASMEKSFETLRNCGVAGHSTAWGGFAVFGVAVSLGGILSRREDHVKRPFYRFQLWTLLVLAFINTLFSGSRVAMAALLAVYLAATFVGVIQARRKFRFFLTYVAGFVLMGIGFAYVLWDRLVFLAFRYGALVEQSGGGRAEQVKAAMSLLRDGQGWLFGIGNAAQRAMATSFGTEVEPVYLLVNYGILGLSLRYGLLMIIFIYAWRQLKRAAHYDRDLTMATILALTGYTVFSLGYFFYQELYSGMVPWLLFGWVVGAYYRENFLRRYRSTSSTHSFREVLS